MIKSILYVSGLCLIMAACGNNQNQSTVNNSPVKQEPTEYDKQLLEKAQEAFRPLPELADQNMPNVISDERVKLGKMLYFDTRLSKTGNNSCNSCHNLATYGVDNMATSKGDAGKLGDRNSPTVLNAALHTAQFWDGRAKNVEEQAGMPILNPVEMAIPNEAFIVARLKEIDVYKKLFKEAFANEANPITYTTLRKSIAAFERTLITPTRFDDYLKGDVFALTTEEREGMNTFIQTGCTQCHMGATLGGNTFQKFGKFADYRTMAAGSKNDEGKKQVTKDELDKDVFKVPGLRNIEKTYPYFHNGSVADLPAAVKVMAKLQLNKDISDAEIKAIVAFLKTLTGNLPDDVKKMPLN